MGVHEYFILDARGRYMTFYRRTPSGDYDHITPDDDGVIQSEVLPGFRFRVADIYRKPSMLAMAEDAVYQDFVMVDFQVEKALAQQERQRAEQERQRAEQERLRAEQERQHAEQERQHAEQERLRAEQERQRAEQERLRAEQEQQRAERAEGEAQHERARAEKLTAKLKALGIEEAE